MWIINAIFWLQAFIAPVILFGFIGVATGSMNILKILIIAGAIIGVFVAEYIRRKIGLDTFFARIYGPNEMDNKKNKKKEVN
ncbi:MAG TPA: hypothetical protein PKC72_17155 [Chitinophagaceae bacterium]|nr:hypothetical protein [Chitinophagaceae bacterium]